MAKVGSVEKSQEITVAEKEDEEKDEEGLNILSQNEEIGACQGSLQKKF